MIDVQGVVSNSLRLSRALYLLVIVFVCAAVFLKVDVVVSADGRLDVNSTTFYIFASKNGRLAGPIPQNGSRVINGERIVNYDCADIIENIKIEQQQSENNGRTLAARLEISRQFDDKDLSDALVGKFSKRQRSMRSVERKDVERYSANVAKLNEERRIERQRFESEVNLQRLSTRDLKFKLAQARSQHNRLLSLQVSGATSKASVEAAQFAVREAANRLDRSIFEEKQLKAAHASNVLIIEKNLQAMSDENIKEVYGLDVAISKAEVTIAILRARAKFCAVASPAAGRILWLVDLFPGMWVSEGAKLGRIVEDDQPTFGLIDLPEKYRAFVHMGQKARVKIVGLPFIQYGTLDATVVFIAPERRGDGGYPITLKVEPSAPWLSQNDLVLTPGMSLQADIVIGERRVYQYFSEPIERAFVTSFRER
jgi:multidrug efflux pump subunit AcrA (membrane-fusion protein)